MGSSSGRRVAMADVARVAKQYLRPERLIVVDAGSRPR